MNLLEKISRGNLPKDKIPHFKAGDVVRVYCKIIEGEKERVQLFEGVVIKRHNNGISSTFTVRKVSYGVGIERVFPVYASTIDRIEVLTSGRVRRAKLYYLRNLSGKKARITEIQKKFLVTKPVINEALPATSETSSEAI